MIALSEIGQCIAAARKSARLTQSQLAELASVSRPTIVLLENGRATELGYSKVVRILAAVGLELRLNRVTGDRPTLDDLISEESSHD